MNAARTLLWTGAAAAVLYCATLIGIGALDPNYDHARQFASELGMATARYASLFNGLVLLQGLLLLAAGAGFHRVLLRLTSRGLAATVGLFVGLFGVSYFFAALFPLPDPLHGAFGIALLTFLVPWILAWAFRHDRSARTMVAAQWLATPVILVTALIQGGLFGLAEATNQGLYQRVAATIFYVWLVATCFWLAGRGKTRAERSARIVP
jgi:hypothetical membrane protein